MEEKLRHPEASGKRSNIKKRRIILGAILAVLLCLFAAAILYASGYYHADEEAVYALSYPPQGMTVIEQKNDQIAFVPEHPIAGLIFYPGGRVQYEAYVPLMEQCAARGILCVLLHMPFNLAVLNGNAADGVVAAYPQVKNWYIGGHSLGGVMAASYAKNHIKELSGLFLLAAYPNVDLSDSGLQVLTAHGTADHILNMEKYNKGMEMLPMDTTKLVIEGGNHANFGNYGPQKGDGTPEISRQEQLEKTVDAITELMGA